MSLQIPTSQTLPFYSETVLLEGTSYNLFFKWNVRDSAWYMSIQTSNQVDIVDGIKIVCDWGLLRRYRSLAVPPGEIVAVDTTGAGIDPGLNDLGTRVILTYVTSPELSST